MWHQVGFLADAFAVFKEHGMSVDLVSTSETNVTVSLDPAANTLDGELLRQAAERSVQALRRRGHRPCAAVRLVGRNIRAILHKLGDAFALVRGAEGLPAQPGGQRSQLHLRGGREPGRPAGRAAARPADSSVSPATTCMGPTWEQMVAEPEAVAARAPPWWATKREELIGALATRDSAYVYDLAPGRRRARSSLGASVASSRVLYALKANPHPEILRTSRPRARVRLRLAGRDASACSTRCRASIPTASCSRRTSRRAPNTSGRSQLGVHLTIDNLYRAAALARCSSGAATCWCASTPASAAATTTT